MFLLNPRKTSGSQGRASRLLCLPSFLHALFSVIDLVLVERVPFRFDSLCGVKSKLLGRIPGSFTPYKAYLYLRIKIRSIGSYCWHFYGLLVSM